MTQTLLMACADEGLQERLFRRSRDGRDYTCSICGWMQHSTAAGAAELCFAATWNSVRHYQRYAQVARTGGITVPELPTHFRFPGLAHSQSLTLVRLDGEIRLALHAPRLGCLSAQGSVILEFLASWDRPLFEAKVRTARFADGPRPSLLHLDGLSLVQTAAAGCALPDGRPRLGQCQLAYVLDLDANTFAVYVPSGCASVEEMESKGPFVGIYALDALPSEHDFAEAEAPL